MKPLKSCMVQYVDINADRPQQKFFFGDECEERARDFVHLHLVNDRKTFPEIKLLVQVETVEEL